MDDIRLDAIEQRPKVAIYILGRGSDRALSLS